MSEADTEHTVPADNLVERIAQVLHKANCRDDCPQGPLDHDRRIARAVLAEIEPTRTITYTPKTYQIESSTPLLWPDDFTYGLPAWFKRDQTAAIRANSWTIILCDDRGRLRIHPLGTWLPYLHDHGPERREHLLWASGSCAICTQQIVSAAQVAAAIKEWQWQA